MINKVNKIKVCFIISGDIWGGAESQFYEIIKILLFADDLDIKVIILNKGQLFNCLLKLNIDIFLVEEKNQRYLLTLKKIFCLIVKINPDIIHTQRYKENITASILKILKSRIRLVRTQHTTFFTVVKSDSKKMQLVRILDIIVAVLFFNRVVCVSHHIRNQIKGLLKKRAVTIHNFFDCKKLPISVPVKKNLHSIKRNRPFYIGYVGRLVEVKGLKYLIEAADILSKSGIFFKMLIVGDGPEKIELNKSVNLKNLNKRIYFVGFRSEIYNIIKNLDVLVLPSLYEGIPMTLLEAMCLNTPVIASNVGGVPEVITNFVNGILIKSKAPEDIAASCRYLIENPTLKFKFVRNASDIIENKFNPKKQINKLINLYADII